MPTSRRNMIVGLGALTVGGGAVFGSGAFSSVEAERGIEVNVVTGEDLDNIDNEDDAGVIAEEFADVRVNVGAFDSVFINDTTDLDDGTGFEPSGSDIIGEEGEVSLIANEDPTVIFGEEAGGLPANSSIEYDSLFRIYNSNISSDSDDEEFDVTLSLDGADENFLAIDRSGDAGDEVNENNVETVPGDDASSVGPAREFDSAVVTGDGGGTPADSATLTITIEKSS